MLQELQLTEQTVVFSDGQYALDYVVQHCLPEVANGCPDLTLLDLNMPVMGGFEFLERLTGLGQTALIQKSILVLTTSENGQDYLQAQYWQVKDYLVKPITLEKMTDFLNRHYSANGNRGKVEAREHRWKLAFCPCFSSRVYFTGCSLK